MCNGFLSKAFLEKGRLKSQIDTSLNFLNLESISDPMPDPISVSALIAINLIIFSACPLEGPPPPPQATSLDDGIFPTDFNWKFTTALVIPSALIDDESVIIRRDNGDIVYRGAQDYSADVRLSALLGQK